jgi:hypothetical protein
VERTDNRAIAAIGIVTRDRVAEAVACLRSYIDHGRKYGRTPEFIVVDDAGSDERGAQTREAIRPLEAVAGGGIRYIGMSRKRRFAERLAREAAVRRELVDFALFGDRRCRISTGANRNSLLLETLDALALSVDDDTRCVIASPPEANETVTAFSGYDPTEFWFFDDRRQALASASFVDVDLLARHEALLGRALGDGSERIAITLQGLLGDSGMGSPRYYLGLTGASRDRLVTSRERYRSAFRSREILRSVLQPTCAATPFCMTTCYGFDNRSLLPPFFPVQRNSDGIFGLVLHRCVAGAYVGFVPYVIAHEPQPARVFPADQMWDEVTSIAVSDIVLACVIAHDVGREPDTSTRLQRLGRHLRELGAMAIDDFEARVRAFQQYRVTAFITLLESRLQTHGASQTFWADDAKRMIELLQAATNGEDYLVPRDLRNILGVEAARRLSRELIGRFGELLEAWPALVAAARVLRANGHGLSTPL